MRRPVLLALALAASACAPLAATAPAGVPVTTVTSAAPAKQAGVPGAMLNPAVTQETLATTVCVSGWSKSVRPPSSYTEALRGRMLAAYGLAPGTVAELDHVIPISAGGAPRSHANLYPEPIALAREDDKVENRLHDYLCSGRVSLLEAQSQLRTLKLSHGYRPDVTF